MKIKILVLGYSRIFQKRVLPSFKKIKLIESVSVASVSKKVLKDNYITKVYNNYDQALKNFTGTFIYVSLSNNLHDEFVLKSLKKGFNVIVDKPAIIKEKTLLEIQEIIKNSNLGIYESSVYSFHPVFNYIRILLKKHKIDKVISTFRIPMLQDNDFRFKNLLGSGADFDMSVYSLGFFNEIFNEEINDLKVLDVRKLNNIVKSFDIQIKTKNNIDFYGFYGFGSEYEHSVFFIGENIKFEINRIFSNPSDTKLVLKKTIDNKIYFEEFDKTDSFYNFFKNVFNDKENNKKISFKKLKANYISLNKLRSKIIQYEKSI